MTNAFNLTELLTGEFTQSIHNDLINGLNKENEALKELIKPSTIIKRYTAGVTTKIAGTVLLKKGKVSIKKTVAAAITVETIDTIVGYQLNKRTIKSNNEIIAKISGKEKEEKLEKQATSQINKTLKYA